MAPLPLTPSARGKATLERPVTLALALALAACAPRPPRVAVGELAAGLEDFLAAHPLAADQDIRADEVSRTASASYHLVQVRGSERPHRHAAHDLTVFVLRGRGTLALGEVRRALEADGFRVARASRYAMLYRHEPRAFMRLFSLPGLLPIAKGGVRLVNAAAGSLGNKLVVQGVRP